MARTGFHCPGTYLQFKTPCSVRVIATKIIHAALASHTRIPVHDSSCTSLPARRAPQSIHKCGQQVGYSTRIGADSIPPEGTY